MTVLKIFSNNDKYSEEIDYLVNNRKAELIDSLEDVLEDELILVNDENGVGLRLGAMSLTGDLNKIIKRVKPGIVNAEMLVKAARIKGKSTDLKAIDATAGMGEDSFLLAAAGFNVRLYEYDPVIALLLKDTVSRALDNEYLHDIATKMEVFTGNSIDMLEELDEYIDVIFLDPMFPERTKSAMIGKKFQLLQKLESPCSNEEELFNAARKKKPKKIVVKRPIKGPELAGIKPDYVISGKAVRYDCYI